jgi:hypothetical protein
MLYVVCFMQLLEGKGCRVLPAILAVEAGG